jgi:hypothetical protein
LWTNLPDKKYDDVNYTVEEGLYYRLSLLSNFLQLSVLIAPKKDQERTNNKVTLETIVNTCIKALEIIRRTGKFSEPLPNLFDKNYMVGIPADIQVREFVFKPIEDTCNSLSKYFKDILQNLEVEDLNDVGSILDKWDELNKRDNSFLVASHLVHSAFNLTAKEYFSKLEFKEIVFNELKMYKYDLEKRMQKVANQDELNDINTYLEFGVSLQALLTVMATNKSNLLNYINKNSDMVYLIHIGVKLCII